MNLRNFGLALGLAGLGLITGSTSVQALTWDFNTNFGSGYLSISEDNPTDGEHVLSDFSFTANNQSYGSWKILNPNTNYKVGILKNKVDSTYINNLSNTSSLLTISNQRGNNSNNISTISTTYASGPFGFSFPMTTITTVASDPNFPTFQQRGVSAAVPFNFSPEQGVVLGLPLFIGLRMLKKRMALRKSKVTVEEVIN